MQITDQTNLVITLPTIGHLYRGSSAALFLMHQNLSTIVVGNKVIKHFTLKVQTNRNPLQAEAITFEFIAPSLSDNFPPFTSLDRYYAAKRVTPKDVEWAIDMLLAKHGFLEQVRQPATPPTLLLK